MQKFLLFVQNFLGEKIASLFAPLFLAAMLGALGGCGGSGPGIEGSAVGGTTPGTPTTPGTSGVPTITLAFSNAAGASVNSISSGTPATVKATLKDAVGAVVPNAVVTFGTDAALATLSPSAKALTNASGVATVTLNSASNAAVGAATITATAEVGTATATGTLSFAIESTATSGEALTLKLALTNPAGATVSSISIGAPATVKATLRDAAGALVSNGVVTFSTDTALATIAPATTALTDASGVATVTLSPATITSAGASTITATAQLRSTASGAANITVTGSTGFAVGVAAVTVAAPVIGVGTAPLSAFGTTSISVTVSLGGAPIATPQSVTFTSACAGVGKAVLSTGIATVAGVATGSYRDNGCAGTDVITASVAGVTSASTSLVVTPPATGSIQFVSATPGIISLKGIGGTEAAQVRFKVLDSGGTPLSGKTVTFGLSTTVGGITLTPSAPATAISDASGLVAIGVNAGTVSTPVRVTASTPGATGGATLTTQSSALTITTGIPDQDSFSLSATVLNPEFMDVDGNTTVLTARLADHFNNPVPDGTVINFTTEGGSIVATCSTTGSLCSSTLTSQAPRLATDGRYTVLAYAVGEESFIDLNGNGLADLSPSELVDQNGRSTDLGEAYRDDNENGLRDATETFLDFNQNGLFDGPDGKYSGVLCDNVTPPPTGSSAGSCAGRKSIHVRKSIVIVFSGSDAVISKTSPSGPITLTTTCTGESKQVDLRIVDAYGNPMPAGTRIEFKTSDGTISGNSSFAQANTNVTPSPGARNYSISIRDDGVLATSTDATTGVTTTTCTDPNKSGVLSVTVTTPRGVVSTAQYPIN